MILVADSISQMQINSFVENFFNFSQHFFKILYELNPDNSSHYMMKYLQMSIKCFLLIPPVTPREGV